MYSDILSYIKAKSDQQQVVAALDDLLDSFYESKNFDELVRKNFSQNFAPFLKKDQTFLNDLKTQVLNMKDVNLTIAVNLPLESLDKIISWVKSNLGSDYLVEFDINPELLGGVQIEFNGKFYDYSVQKYVNLMLKSK